MDFSHQHFMKFALEQALAAYEADEVPVGAIIVRDDRIIGIITATDIREARAKQTAGDN